MGRRVRKVVLWVASPLLIYLVAGNALILSPLLTHLTNRNPTVFMMRWGLAVTWWPGEVYVRDFHLTFSAHGVAFDLTIDEARADILLTELLRRRFHAEDVRAHGVSWRFVHKDEAARYGTARDAAFPFIEGVVPFQLGPPPEPSKHHKPWSVQLDRVDARIREAWVLEYRWNGSGRARGDFELVPGKHFWVGPVDLTLDPGMLTVGGAQLTSSFGGHAVTIITPTPLYREKRLRLLGGLTVDGRFHMNVDDLSFVRVYGLEAEGSGELDLDAHIHGGVISPGTALTLSLPDMRWRNPAGAGFSGSTVARLEYGERPVLSTMSSGELLLPGPLVANVPFMEGAVSLTTNALTEGPRLATFQFVVDELEVPDGAGVNAALKGRVPFLVPVLLGEGRLVAHDVRLHGTQSKVGLSVGQASMGETSARGELEISRGGASGAVEAHVRSFGIGVELDRGQRKLHFFTKRGWLEQQLAERHARAAPRAQ